MRTTINKINNKSSKLQNKIKLKFLLPNFNKYNNENSKLKNNKIKFLLSNIYKYEN